MAARISEMTFDDVNAVAGLSGQLGYPATPEQVRRSLETIRTTSGQEVLVARVEPLGTVVGWLHVYEHLSIATGPRCEIGGLVVDETCRGKGIGTLLISAAEHWAETRGMAGVQFSSRTSRTEAHRLYERLGYRIQKTSHIFSKQLS
jgi:ribosomal protein S18 acetylase RimI-like enzyme